MRSTSRARMVLVAAAATMACGLGGVASAPAFATVPPGGGPVGDPCMPINDSVTFSGSNVSFTAHATCDVTGTLYVYGAKNSPGSANKSKTCGPNQVCTVTYTIKSSGAGKYCMRSANDTANGQVLSDGNLCQTH